MSGGVGILLPDSFLAGRSGGFGTAAFAFFAVISACSIFLSPAVAGMLASVFFGGGAVAVASCLPECRLFVLLLLWQVVPVTLLVDPSISSLPCPVRPSASRSRVDL